MYRSIMVYVHTHAHNTRCEYYSNAELTVDVYIILYSSEVHCYAYIVTLYTSTPNTYIPTDVFYTHRCIIYTHAYAA